MSIIRLVTTCVWFLLVSNFSGANQANINCLKTFKFQVEDPNGYLTSWIFRNETSGFICNFSGVSCWHDDENRVLSIDLSGYGLRGEFPLGINECSDLTGLNLSRNNFSGPLPSNISSLLPLGTHLDLSYNKFSGEIPDTLSNITFLNTLMLEHNQFTGKVPPELALLQRLSVFSVADNLLSGRVPDFNIALNIGVESFANNKGLCGRPMEDCVDPEEDMFWLGKIAAGIGAAIFAPVGASLGCFLFKEKQRNVRHRSWIYHFRD